MIQLADVLATGLSTAVGLGAQHCAAAVRAGISGFRESDFLTGNAEPLVMSLVADPYLPPLDPRIPSSGETSVRSRMVQLATWALREAHDPVKGPLPIFLAGPEKPEGRPDPIDATFLRDLAIQSGTELDERRSRLYRQGGAGGLLAVRDALALLSTGQLHSVLVGGVDSFLDEPRLEALEEERRLLGPSADGFIPGEGAAFLLLGSRSETRHLRRQPMACITGASAGTERGHRYSEEPYRGDGLAETFQALFASRGAGPKVQSVYAGLNGESLPVKEWGVAYLRSAERFDADFSIDQPADCVGDIGAALGPAMLVLAAIAIQRSHRKPPTLVWSTSDREARAAALLEPAA